MVFPPFSAFFGNIFCFTPGVVFFIMGLGFAHHSLHEYRTKRTLPTDPPILFILGSLFIGGVFACALVFAGINYLSFRFDPTTVEAIRVRRVADEQSLPLDPPVVFTERDALKVGFAFLARARTHSRNHESDSEGYQIEIRLQGESDYMRTLTIYQKTTRTNQPADIVLFAGREYRDPAFHQWLRTTIDPLVPPLFTAAPPAQDGAESGQRFQLP